MPLAQYAICRKLGKKASTYRKNLVGIRAYLGRLPACFRATDSKNNRYSGSFLLRGFLAMAAFLHYFRLINLLLRCA